MIKNFATTAASGAARGIAGVERARAVIAAQGAVTSAAADRVVVARVAPNRAIAGAAEAPEARVEGSKAEDGASAEPVRVVRAARAVVEKVAGRVRIGRSAHPCIGWRLRFDFCRTD